MYKLIHLHTDSKFIQATERFNNKEFFNVNIFLGEDSEITQIKLESQGFDFEVYPKTLETIDEISKKYKDFDGAIIYDLCIYKKQFLDKFPSSFKFFWFFFGYEIYTKLCQYYISKKTLKSAYPINLKKYSFKECVLRTISRMRNREFYLDKQKYENLYKRIDAILVYSEQEYNEITNYVALPKLIKRNLNRKIQFIPREKENSIIIGNSKALWNNHLDIFNIIKSVKNNAINYVCFFSYGQESLYTEKIRVIAKKNKNINIIEDFLDIKEFEQVYQTAAALIINSYRQHALGNIFTAITYGCKVYLNPRSSVYKWLLDEGFNISTVNSLKEDLKNNYFSLTEKEQLFNLNKLKELQDSHTKLDFLNNIKEVLDS